MRVLMVEDEPRLAENVARSLRESAGYAVDVANDHPEKTIEGHATRVFQNEGRASLLALQCDRSSRPAQIKLSADD